MALATYSGDVVIPHRPDWRQRVAWSRAWDTSIESGLTGAEDRRAMRLKPRERIVFRVIPWNAEERIRLLERLKAGVKAGRVLVPNWGRGATLAAGASGTSLAIASPAFTIHSGNPVFIGQPDIDGWELWDVAEVASAVGTTINLRAPLSRTYSAGTGIYPCVIGRLEIGELEALDDWRQSVEIAVLQLRTEPKPIPAFAFDYWLHGAPVPRFFAGQEFGFWLGGSPVIAP